MLLITPQWIERLSSKPQARTVRLRTLTHIRGYAVAGQAIIVLIAHALLDLQVMLVPILTVILISAAANTIFLLHYPSTLRLTETQGFIHLMADLGQLFILLCLSGGMTNPFFMLLVVPVTVSTFLLSWQYTAFLALTALLGGAALFIWAWPIPWSEPVLILPDLYRFGLWTGFSVTLLFLAFYLGMANADARRTDRALAALERNLAAEREMTALSALAAGAVHELGTPLGTIKLAIHDVMDTLPADHPLREEAELIDSQVTRCREILQSLANRGTVPQDHFETASLEAFLHEIIHPFDHDPVTFVLINEAREAAGSPSLPRHPEIVQSLTNFIENAADYARQTVYLRFGWDDGDLWITIADDGPGFDPAILSRLGEPYLSSRRQGSIDHAEASGAGGLGLGIFIATTLLERTGASIRFVNQAEQGAVVSIRWPRSAFESAMPGNEENIG